eukprot:5145202-Karenia_brevis.AAC.1
MKHTITIPPRFNDTIIICPPKKPKEFDARGAVVSPDATRPIGKQNCDNKIISKSQAYAVYPVLQQNASHVQRGFIPGRYYLANVLELDGFAHLWSFKETRDFCQRPGVMAFYDFCKAFPSIAIVWIIRVLTVSGAPEGLVNYVR